MLTEMEFNQGLINCFRRKGFKNAVEMAYIIGAVLLIDISDYRITGDGELSYYEDESIYVECQKYVGMLAGLTPEQIHELAIAYFKWARYDQELPREAKTILERLRNGGKI